MVASAGGPWIPCGTTMRLSPNSLARLPAALPVARPGYDRAALRPAIVHLGLGAFFRAHGAQYTEDLLNLHGGDWGIVGCLATAEPDQIPMATITMMRNALGVDEGGSGVALDREAYRHSVAYWERHANWRAAAD